MMASCECCWTGASARAHFCGGSVSDLYHVVLKEHSEQGCVCTQLTPAGDRARAGQFWDETRLVDIRKDPTTPMPLGIKHAEVAGHLGGAPPPMRDEPCRIRMVRNEEDRQRRLSAMFELGMMEEAVDQLVDDELERCREMLATSEEGRKFLTELELAAKLRKVDRERYDQEAMGRFGP